MGMIDANGFKHSQHGGSKFWPLVTVAIILILLLGYCSLEHRTASRDTRQTISGPAEGNQSPANDSSGHPAPSVDTGSKAEKKVLAVLERALAR